MYFYYLLHVPVSSVAVTSQVATINIRKGISRGHEAQHTHLGMLYRRRHNRRGDTVGLCFVIMMCQQRMSFRSGRILHGDPSDMRGRIPVRNDKRRFIVRINLLRRCHCGSAVERRFRKPLVGGSIPSSGSSSNIIIGRDPSVCEWPHFGEK